MSAAAGAWPDQVVTVDVTPDGRVRLPVPADWTVEAGPPLVARPTTWDGLAPSLVVTRAEHEAEDVADTPEATAGDTLAAALAVHAARVLADPVVVDLVAGGDDALVVVAHRHRDADVTTVERHLWAPGGAGWIAAFTCADADVEALLPSGRAAVIGLRIGGS